MNPIIENEEKEEISEEFYSSLDVLSSQYITYTDLRDNLSRVSLTAYTEDLHEYADFSIQGEYVVFCVGNGKPGLDGNITRLHILIIAKLSNYPVIMNRNGNLVFVRAICKSENLSKKVIRSFRLFISNLRLMFAYKNCCNFDQEDLETEFSDMATIISNMSSLRKLVPYIFFLYYFHFSYKK